MKFLNKIISILILSTSLIFASEKKVLVEIFTNSHCPLCPPAHSTLDSYLNTANADKIEFIYYHMAFPYSSDALYQHNTNDATAKNNFYGPHSSTPKSYFNGMLVTNSYSNWESSLNGLVTEQSDFDIILSGSFSDSEFNISADISFSGNSSTSDLTINYVVVEDVTYPGNNGITNHKNVMRKITNPQGDSFLINTNEITTLSTTISKNPQWNTDNLKVIVFVQNKSTKEVLQSTSIAYSDFTITDVENESLIVKNFSLEQNYPNPFNPTTTILYTIPSNSKENSHIQQNVILNVFDILGKKIATLVDEQQSAGNYKIEFNASNLAAGFYFYQLKTDNYSKTRKMILLK